MPGVRWIIATIILLSGGVGGAQEPSSGAPFTVAITRPAAIEEYPGIEKTLTVTISNDTRAPVRELMLYTTMADVTRNLVVDLADFSASKVYTIDTIEPMKSASLEVPLKLAFTGDFYLYVTAISKDTGMTAFSRAIPVKIYGATAPSERLVVIVSTIVSGILLIALLWSLFRRSGFRRTPGAITRPKWPR